jgi:hypothetical protein
VADVHVETGPMVAIVAVILPGVLGVLVLGQHAGMLVVGVVLHAAAVGPDMNLVSGVHHLVSAGPDRCRCSHDTGWGRGPTC